VQQPPTHHQPQQAVQTPSTTNSGVNLPQRVTSLEEPGFPINYPSPSPTPNTTGTRLPGSPQVVRTPLQTTGGHPINSKANPPPPPRSTSPLSLTSYPLPSSILSTTGTRSPSPAQTPRPSEQSTCLSITELLRHYVVPTQFTASNLTSWHVLGPMMLSNETPGSTTPPNIAGQLQIHQNHNIIIPFWSPRADWQLCFFTAQKGLYFYAASQLEQNQNQQYMQTVLQQYLLIMVSRTKSSVQFGITNNGAFSSIECCVVVAKHLLRASHNQSFDGAWNYLFLNHISMPQEQEEQKRILRQKQHAELPVDTQSPRALFGSMDDNSSPVWPPGPPQATYIPPINSRNSPPGFTPLTSYPPPSSTPRTPGRMDMQPVPAGHSPTQQQIPSTINNRANSPPSPSPLNPFSPSRPVTTEYGGIDETGSPPPLSPSSLSSFFDTEDGDMDEFGFSPLRPLSPVSIPGLEDNFFEEDFPLPPSSPPPQKKRRTGDT